jgi:hypothetical protein
VLFQISSITGHHLRSQCSGSRGQIIHLQENPLFAFHSNLPPQQQLVKVIIMIVTIVSVYH